MENKDFSKRPALIYALLILAANVASYQTVVFSLWFSRRCYERSRGEMITMLYEKTLSRKIIDTPDEATSDDESSNVPNGNGPPETATKTPSSLLTKLCEKSPRFLNAIFRGKSALDTSKEVKGKTRASTGKILNLMRYVSNQGSEVYGTDRAPNSNDVYEVSQR